MNPINPLQANNNNQIPTRQHSQNSGLSPNIPPPSTN